MKKAVIFGSTNTGRRIYDEIKSRVEIIGFLDEDSEKWGGTSMDCLYTLHRNCRC